MSRSPKQPETVSRTAAARPVRRRYRTRFVDAAALEATTAGIEQEPPVEPRVRVIGRVDDAADAVRANVQDAARAVLTWLASVVGHRGDGDLETTLDRCLRPGPDVERVNYAALAAEVSRVTGVELTAKRVQTAVAHLRRARRRKAEAAALHRVKSTGAAGLQSLEATLRDRFDELAAAECGGLPARDVAVEVLAAVRAAAGRLIDRDFGEGIVETLDRPSTGGRFLRFVGSVLQEDDAPATGSAAAPALRRFMQTLAEHPGRGRSEADMRLVLDGAKVVSTLVGEASLPGVMAHLNVMVAGRDLTDTDLYVAEMLRLAALAEALHDDPATERLRQHARRLPEDRRLPSPIRVSSYCRSNAATRLYDRIHRGDLDPHATALADATGTSTYLQLADATHDAMLARDGGFTLTLTTELLRHVVHTRVTGDRAALDAYLHRLGEAKALDRLEALVRYENNDALVAEAHDHAVRVYPSLRNRLICAA